MRREAGTGEPRRVRRKPGTAIAIGIVFAALGVECALLAFIARQTTRVDHLSIDQLASFRARYTNRKAIINGFLVPGSLLRFDTPCSYQFELYGEHATIAVRYPHCTSRRTFDVAPPYAFHLGALGVLAPDGHFEAEDLLVRSHGPYRLDARAPEPDAWIGDAGRDVAGSPQRDF